MKKEYYVICNTKKEFLTNQNNKLVFTKNKELANVYETEKEAIEFEDKFSNDIEGLTYIYKIKNDKIIKMGENKMSLRDFIQNGDDYFAEARDKEVSAEFRIALGKLKGIYGNDEVPTSKVFNKDADMIIKKYNLDVSFKEYAKKNIKINESEEQENKDYLTVEETQDLDESMKVINQIQKLLPKGDLHIGKIGKEKEYVWTFKDSSYIRVSSSETYNRIEYYAHGGEFITSFLTVGELKSYLNSSNLLSESKSKEDLIKYYEKNLKNVEKEYSTDSRKQEYIDYAKGQLAAVKKDGNAGLIKFLKDWNMNEGVLKFKVGDIVNLDVNSIENSEYVNQFPGKNVPKSVKIISPKINVNGDFTFEVPKYKGKEAILPKKFILESAVGTPGRTTKEDAEAHITPELRAEFEKIIKQIGGKAVARALLDGNPDNGEITEKVVGYCVTGFKDEEDFKRVQKKFFKDGLSWGRDSSKDEKGKEALKQAGVRSFDDLALYTEGKDMYVTDKGNTQRRKDLNKIDADEIK